MKNIKSFEEYQPTKTYRFVGERFISSIDQEINDVIDESYGMKIN